MRNFKYFLILLIASMFIIACDGDDDNGGNGDNGNDENLPPPNVPEQEPAFEEQTRAPRVDSDFTLEQETFASGLVHPWSIEFLPSGRVLVSERPGRIRVISQFGDVFDPLSGVPEVDSRDQGGLLDLALAPDFNISRMVYFSYAEPRDGNTNGTTVARARLSDDETALENMEVIFRQTPAWEATRHYGSRLVWDTDGNLFITLGERSQPEPRQLAQDLSTHLGKIVRIQPDGSIPPDNPFVDQEGALPEIWSYGHRNIQGADLHPDSGELWTIEHGPQGGDELNTPEPGNNYGWPVITYGEDYTGEPIGEGITQMEGMEQPIYYWDPVIAPGGVTFYTGSMFMEWQGDLLISSLTPGGIVRLEFEPEDGSNGPPRVAAEERLLTDIGRVRDIKVGPDDALYIVTDEEDGILIKLTRSE